MKKILVVDALAQGCAGHNFFTGGVERHNYILCKVLSKIGYDVHTIQTRYNNLSADECSYKLKNVTQHFIGPSCYIDVNLTDQLEKRNFITNWGRNTYKHFTTVVQSLGHFHFAFNNFRGRYSKFLCEQGISTIQPTHCSTSQHGGLPGSVHKYLQTCKFFSSEIFKFGYISEFVKNDYILYAQKYLDYEISEDYMTEHIEALSEFNGEVLPEEKHFTIISRCNPDKNPHIALELSIAAGKEVHFYTTIQDRKYYEEKIRKYESHLNVKIFIDYPHNRILDDLRRSRGLIMTARKETFGIVGVEALERGVPIVYASTGRHLGEDLCIAPQDALISPNIKEIVTRSINKKAMIERIKTLSLTIEEREMIARETRLYFSEEKWRKNLKRLIQKNETH